MTTCGDRSLGHGRPSGIAGPQCARKQHRTHAHWCAASWTESLPASRLLYIVLHSSVFAVPQLCGCYGASAHQTTATTHARAPVSCIILGRRPSAVRPERPERPDVGDASLNRARGYVTCIRDYIRRLAGRNGCATCTLWRTFAEIGAWPAGSSCWMPLVRRRFGEPTGSDAARYM